MSLASAVKLLSRRAAGKTFLTAVKRRKTRVLALWDQNMILLITRRTEMQIGTTILPTPRLENPIWSKTYENRQKKKIFHLWCETLEHLYWSCLVSEMLSEPQPLRASSAFQVDVPFKIQEILGFYFVYLFVDTVNISRFSHLFFCKDFTSVYAYNVNMYQLVPSIATQPLT